ncbi:AraC family transcriptional regulator [Paenibacillus pinihumi]|uniref:AraC family transcriptional regulator n=1 Tax=Paenibacillus pinihumi TaxID=669462 RepID=UPI00048EFDC0|nr:AraC family transcriptional regulator [Paenibacillus pinihumi]
MINVDQLAEALACSSYKIKEVYRLVIQQKSVLREFRTEKYGFLFIIQGQARLRVNGVTYELQPGSVFHAAPFMQMDSRVVGESELEYYSVFYSPEKRSEEEYKHVCNAHFKLEHGALPRIIDSLLMLHEHVRTPGGMGKLRAKELFLSIMHQVLGSHLHHSRGTSPSKKVIDEAIAYIKKHYMEMLTLDELAELHAMNPKQFSYYFHKYTGFRPIDYVIHYRMERARELLQTGDFPIRDIAASVGYTNPLYFSRLFKKKLGITPSSYLEKNE